MVDSRFTVTIDPKDYAGMAFVPHGYYKAVLDGPLFLSQLTGPFNTEILRIYGKKVAPLFELANARGPWGGVAVFHESMMMSPDALELFAQNLAALMRSGIRQVAVAHVAAPTVEGREIMSRLFAERAFGPAGLPYRFFSEEAAALDWVNGQLR